MGTGLTTSDPVLSIIVAVTAGTERDLARCLSALTAQEGPPPMEIIVPLDPPCRHLSHLQDRFPDVAFLQVEMEEASVKNAIQMSERLQKGFRAPIIQSHAPVVLQQWPGEG